MTLRPAGRFFTIPFPPDPFAARLLAAVIRPPLLFFDIWFLSFFVSYFAITCFYGTGMVIVLASIVTAPIRASALPSNVAPVFNVID
jgi:hypothetical protein